MTDLTLLAVSINDAVKITSFKRTKLYALIAAGEIKTKKSGHRTIIEMAELRRFIDNLPVSDPPTKKHREKSAKIMRQLRSSPEYLEKDRERNRKRMQRIRAGDEERDL